MTNRTRRPGGCFFWMLSLLILIYKWREIPDWLMSALSEAVVMISVAALISIVALKVIAFLRR